MATWRVNQVAIIGGNGTMGVRTGALLAESVPRVCLLARSREKAEIAVASAAALLGNGLLSKRLEAGEYKSDLRGVSARSDLIIEAASEDRDVKREIVADLDRCRCATSVVASMTGGLSITEIASGRSRPFVRNFVGLHLFNPPQFLRAAEVTAGQGTDESVLDAVTVFLRTRCRRIVVRTPDAPGFLGNRIGFSVLNAAATLAVNHSPLVVDRVLGPHTGREMPPLATIDMIGWDVYCSTLKTLYSRIRDDGRASFEIPPYMKGLCDRGFLGRKVNAGFYRRMAAGLGVLSVEAARYDPASAVVVPEMPFVDTMLRLQKEGRFGESIRVLLREHGAWAEVARGVIARYVGDAFHIVRELGVSMVDIDRVMRYGFRWTPPGAFVEIVGASALIDAMQDAGLPVPPLLATRV